MYVCADCIQDYAIQDFIRSIASETVCSYCGNSSEDEIAAPLSEVVDFMKIGIDSEYDDPNNCVGWEGGWQGADVFDSEELINDYIGLECGSVELTEDIIEALGDQEWCQRDPYGLRPEQSLEFGWNSFCEQIKHHTRYIFFRVGTTEEEEGWLTLDEIPVSKMLDRVSREISELESEMGIVRENLYQFVNLAGKSSRRKRKSRQCFKLGYRASRSVSI